MFGRRKAREEEERRREARKQEREKERQEYWAWRFDRAKDEHETTRITMEKQHD